MLFTVLSRLKVMVCNCNSSQSLFCIVIDDCFDFGNNVVVERGNLTRLVNIGLAAREDHLRGTFDKQSLVIAASACCIFNDS